MRRREFIAVAGAVAMTWPLAARGQQAGRSYRVACVWVNTEPIVRKLEEALLSVLRDRGYVVGRNLIYESRYANGELTRVPGLVDELIALQPDVLAGIEQVARVMIAKTSAIPIVIMGSSDPVAAGLVKSLSSPGGNVTGVAFQFAELGPKHIELMREILPRLARVGQMHDTNVPGSKLAEENTRQAAQKFGIAYVPYHVANRADVERAFAEMEKDPPDALVPSGGSGLLYGLRQMLIDNALRLRIPFSSNVAEFPELGGLISYGTNLEDVYRLAATYVDRILKGAKPGELPVEQTSKFELVINLKTAKALGLTIPQSVLSRADKVLE